MQEEALKQADAIASLPGAEQQLVFDGSSASPSQFLRLYAFLNRQVRARTGRRLATRVGT